MPAGRADVPLDPARPRAPEDVRRWSGGPGVRRRSGVECGARASRCRSSASRCRRPRRARGARPATAARKCSGGVPRRRWRRDVRQTCGRRGRPPAGRRACGLRVAVPRRAAAGSRPRGFGQRRDVGGTGPVRELRRHRHRSGQSQPEPVADDVGARRRRSPSRLPLALTSDTNQGGHAAQNTQISTTPTRCRTKAWWKEIGPASSRTVRVPITNLPDAPPQREGLEGARDRPPGRPATTTMLPTAYERLVGRQQPRPAMTPEEQHVPGCHVDQAGEQPDAEGGRGQLEGDRLAGDELVGVEPSRSVGGHRPERRALGSAEAVAVPLPHGPRRLRGRAPPGVASAEDAEPSGARRSGAEADELVDLLPGGRHPPERDPRPAPPTPRRGHLPERPAGPRAHPGGGHADAGWSGVADFFVRRFPAALYRTRRWWLGRDAGCYAIAAVMIWWLLAHPQVEQTLLDPKQVDAAGQQRLRRLLQAVRRLALRGQGVDQQRLGRGVLHRLRGARRCRSSRAVAEPR